MRTSRHLLLTLGCASALAAAPAALADSPSVTLTGRAVLPARTFASGPPSGRLLGAGPINGVRVPFAGQPVQGFSAVLPAGGGDYWAMPDNGYGSLENSADFNLRMYRIHPYLETADGGPGKIGIERYIQLHDPDRHVPFALVNQFTHDRVLTGADFDIESVRRGADGTLWFGDEFGPFLLHTDARGKVLDAPVPLPDLDHPGLQIRAPQNPYSEESSPVRIMNAVHQHALAHGDTKVPVVSPDAELIADNDPSTDQPDRTSPPAGSGLAPASSDIFNIASLHAAGYPVVPYTVDDPAHMDALLKLGVDGLISDRSDLLFQEIAAVKPEYLLPDGRIDPAKFDAEGHRGSRDLRPENTLPAMEAGLDNLMNTMETDFGITKDGVPVLSHDPHVMAQKCRRTDGQPYTEADEVLIKDLTLAQLRSQFICDKVFRGPTQSNDPALSPVAVAFAANRHLPSLYSVPTVQELFDFAGFYARWFETGPGRDDPRAPVLAANARAVRFNIETKINPRTDPDPKGVIYARRTAGFRQFADAIGTLITANHLTRRAFVQSFDFRTLLRIQERFPAIRTVYLFGDFPVYADQSVPGSDDGTNLQPLPGQANTPWMAGLYWPYRHTALENPFRAQSSGGFEGMGASPDGRTLYPMLEKPLLGDDPKTLLIHAFDTSTGQYTGERWRYRLDPRGVSVGDFTLYDRRHGVTVERDNTQGDLSGYKAINAITLGAPETYVDKQQVVDLLQIADPARISLPRLPGDVGLGNPFAFPFVTIEDVAVLGPRRLVVLNDNNFPFSVGRHVGSGRPDDEELIRLSLGTPLP